MGQIYEYVYIMPQRSFLQWLSSGALWPFFESWERGRGASCKLPRSIWRARAPVPLPSDALRVGTKPFEPPCAAAVKRKGVAVKRALTPGTFDPITAGHLDVISRAAQLVDEVIVAVAVSAKKKPLFSLEERVALEKEVTRDLPNVRVEPFDELLVDFARRMGAQAVVKGLRAITDFEYEFQMTALNYQLDKELETLFIMSTPQHMYLSSSIVREIASLGGDVSQFVPPCVNEALVKRYAELHAAQ